MASVRKHPKSKFWYACFTDSNGVRTTRSTKTKNRTTALKMAVEWEKAATQASEGRLTEAQARTVINSIMEHAGQEPVTFYKIRDWFEEWIEEKKKSSQDATYKKYQPVVCRFLKHLGAKAELGLASLTPVNIRSFRDLLAKEGRAARTVNHTVAKILSAPLSKATSLGYMPINPCKAVEPLKEETTEAGVFTLEQIADLLKAAPSADWKGLILAGFYTGQRLRDTADLIWGQVNLAERMIFLKQRKGGSRVAIPIHQDLLDFLLTLPATDNPKAPVFKTLFGKSGPGRTGLSEAFKRIMVKAGIELKKRLESAGKAGRGRNELSFHNRLRRRCAMLERSIGSSANRGRTWYGYAAYRPEQIAKLLTIFRACHNYIWLPSDLTKKAKKETPAMKLGLAKAPLNYRDVVYFRVNAMPASSR